MDTKFFMIDQKADNKKDTSKTTSKEGDNKPILKDSSDGYQSYLHKKLEKIVSALYLLTGFFPDGDPLKLSIRQRGLELLNLAHSDQTVTESGGYSRMLEAIHLLLSELRVAHNVGIISDMNFQVLASEFSTVQDGFSGHSTVKKQPYFAPDYFSSDQSDIDQVTSDKIRNNPLIQSSSDAGGGLRTGEGVDTEDEKGDESPPSRKNGPKKRREGIILGLLKDETEVSVKDVTKVIPNYSAKTIQRDLKALVKKGILEKRGKRRWTTYRLANAPKDQ